MAAAWLSTTASPASAVPPRLGELLTHGPARSLWVGFAAEGDAVAVEHTVGTRGCRGFVAWSEGQGSDVDLALYSRAGQLLSDDHSAAGYGYVRLCGDVGLVVRLVAAAYQGQGEVHVVDLGTAPEGVHALFAGTALGVLPPGSAEGERDVGELSLSSGAEGAMAWGDDAALRQLGYDAVGEPSWVPVTLTGAELELALPKERCTRIDIQAPFQRGVLATVQLSSGELLHGQAPGRDRVSIYACPAGETRARVRVRPRVPRGLVGVRAYVHRLPVAPPPVHNQHAALAHALEIAFVARAHGLVAERVEDVWLDPGGVATRPLPFLPFGCNALMVLPDEGLEVDVRWMASNGQLLALNEGRAIWPVMYHCGPPDTGSLRLRGRGRAGRATLWIARPEGS